MKISTSKKIIIWYLIIYFILTCIVVTTAIIKRIENKKKYDIANNYIKEEKYKEAIDIFDKLNTYKDSEEKSIDSKYNLGIEYYKDGDFENAKKIFTELGDYLDSKIYLTQIDIKLIEQSQDFLYQSAYSYYQNKEYQKALDIYETISDYKGSDYFIIECKKQLKRSSHSNIMSAGINNSITITNMGRIKTAGINGYEQLSVDSWENVISVDIYGSLTIGLLNDKTAKIAGTYNKNNKISNLEQWNDLIDVAAGEQFVVGLKSNGDVIADGHDGDHQIDADGWEGIAAIDTGSRFVVGLTETKELIFSGFDNGQADKFDSLSKEQKEEWKDVVNISASGGEKNGRGGGHTVGLKSDGTLVAIGDNSFGQCDFSNKEKWSDIVKVATGDWYTVGLKSDGTVVMTGENFSGCKYIDEDILNKYDNIVDIAAGYGQTLLLTEDGEIICFGFDDEGKDQLNGFKGAMIPQY